MSQTIRTLMQNPALSSNPEGLAAAADIAYGRYMRTQAPAMQQKIQETKAEVKQAQKASLTEGSGRKVSTSTPPHQAAIESLRKTGSIKDAEAAIGQILRGRGIIVGD
jgi:septal ring-binding cell division protein DamX